MSTKTVVDATAYNIVADLGRYLEGIWVELLRMWSLVALKGRDVG